MTPEQTNQFNNMTDKEKAEGLQRIGWKPAGDGDGPLGESEWWPPPRFENVVSSTCSFYHAIEVTFAKPNSVLGINGEKPNAQVDRPAHTEPEQ